MKPNDSDHAAAHARLAREVFKLGGTDVDEAEVTAYLAGLLSSEAAAQLEARLKIDPQVWSEVKAQKQRCEEHFQPASVAAGQVRFDETLRKLIENKLVHPPPVGDPEKPAPKPSRGWIIWGIAAAAAVILLSVALPVWNPWREREKIIVVRPTPAPQPPPPDPVPPIPIPIIAPGPMYAGLQGERLLRSVRGPAVLATGNTVFAGGANSGWEELPPLKGANNDARHVGKGLFDSDGYDAVTVLVDDTKEPAQRSTRDNVLKSFADLVKRTKDGGTFTVFWASHGVEVNGKVGFVTAPGADGKPGVWTMDDLAVTIGKRKINVVLVVDACRKTTPEASKAFLVKLRESAANYLLVTSCSPGELAREAGPSDGAGLDDEDKEWHGLFTRELLRARRARWVDQRGSIAVADADGDGFLSWKEAASRAQKQIVAALSANRFPEEHQTTQTPSYSQQGQPVLEELSGIKKAIRIEPAFKPKPSIGSGGKPTEAQIIRDLPLEQVGTEVRFYAYKNNNRKGLPFMPSGWMWGGFSTGDAGDSAENEDTCELVSDLMGMSLTFAQNPKSPGQCVRWEIRKWADRKTKPVPMKVDVDWMGIAWISQADKNGPQWWAAEGDNRGLYYDLSRFKSLRFSARFEWDVPAAGALAEKKPWLAAKLAPLAHDAGNRRLALGDSRDTVVKHVQLDGPWQDFAMDITPQSPADGDLSRICSIAFILDRTFRNQFPEGTEIPAFSVYLDDIYFSTKPATEK